eukprot:5975096-Alexandrium_andersonii.AAC.1
MEALSGICAGEQKESMLWLQRDGPEAVVAEPGDVLAAAVPLLDGAELWPRDGGDAVRVATD